MWIDFTSLNRPNLFIVVNKIGPARSSEQHFLQAIHQSLVSLAVLRTWWFWTTNYPQLQRQAPNKWIGINQYLTHHDNQYLLIMRQIIQAAHCTLEYHKQITVWMLLHDNISGREHVLHREIILPFLNICYLF